MTKLPKGAWAHFPDSWRCAVLWLPQVSPRGERAAPSIYVDSVMKPCLMCVRKKTAQRPACCAQWLQIRAIARWAQGAGRRRWGGAAPAQVGCRLQGGVRLEGPLRLQQRRAGHPVHHEAARLAAHEVEHLAAAAGRQGRRMRRLPLQRCQALPARPPFSAGQSCISSCLKRLQTEPDVIGLTSGGLTAPGSVADHARQVACCRRGLCKAPLLGG